MIAECQLFLLRTWSGVGPNIKAYNRPVHIISITWWFIILRTVTACSFACLAFALASPSLAQSPKIFTITDYGATGDGKALETRAIQKTIDTCHAAGGGRVVIPAGVFVSGTLHMKSHVELEIVKGATLKGSPAIKHYPDIRPATESRYGQYLRRAFIFAQQQENIRIFGEGNIDGNRGREFKGRETSRPPVIWLDECKNIIVEGLHLTRPGMWTTVYSRCKNVHINGITIREAYGSNNDGCNLADCEDVLIENCDIDCADDAICLKGFTPYGNRNIVIRNNRLETRVNAIKFGTDSSGGFRNVKVLNNHVVNSNRAAIALEVVDGGIMENVLVDGLTIESASCAFFIKLGNRARKVYENGKWQKPGVGKIRNITLRNITASIGPSPKRLKGTYSDPIPITTASVSAFYGQVIENITLENISIKIRKLRNPLGAMPEKVKDNVSGYPTCFMMGRLQAYGIYCRYVNNLTMKNISLEASAGDPRPAIFLDRVGGGSITGLKTKSNTQPKAVIQVKSRDILMKME